MGVPEAMAGDTGDRRAPRPRPARGRSRHWRRVHPRRFGQPGSPDPRVALLFGVIAPLVCLALDPGVFRVFRDRMLELDIGWGFRFGAAVAFTFIGLQIVALWVAMIRPPNRRPWASLLGGWLMGGVLFALWIGIAILPWSILGLPVVIGILGFMPFVTAVVYSKWSLWVVSEERLGGPAPAAAWLIGVALALGLSFGAQRRLDAIVEHAIARSRFGETPEFREAHEDVARWSWALQTRRLREHLQGVTRSQRGDWAQHGKYGKAIPAPCLRLARLIALIDGGDPRCIAVRAYWKAHH